MNPSLSSLKKARVIRRGARFLSSFSSYAGSGTLEAKAIRVPSGDHAACVTSSFRSVSLRASPPCVSGMTNSCMRSPARFEVKASRVPSGDHLGSPSLRDPKVSCRGKAEPSTGASQTLLLYSLESLSIRAITNATV